MSIVPVDSLPDLKGVVINDLLGSEGEISLRSSKDRFINNLKKLDSNITFDDYVRYENIGLARNMGQWALVSCIKYEKNSETSWDKFKVNALPPKELVIYDTMHLPWSQVKEKVPSALDIFTAPYNDMAVIITEEEVLVYNIKSGQIDDYPVKAIKLKPNEVVIMAEWATGSYVEKWKQEVLNQRNRLQLD
jgi:hypothetical protein